MTTRIILTPAELDELSDAANRTWEIIADDVLRADGHTLVRRSTVIEVVLDADRLTMFNPDLSPRVLQYLSTTSYPALKRAFKTVFPDTHYGY